jgi:predicted RecB family nuclease
MRIRNDKVKLSATDLAGYLGCQHLTQMDWSVAKGDIEGPDSWDPLLDILRDRGLVHEKAFIDHLRDQQLEIALVEGEGVNQTLIDRTEEHLRAGVDIIIQAALGDENWGGRADILRKVDHPSDLGGWSYEVIDTKLARQTKGGTVLQLSLYSDLLARLQGYNPEYMYVVSPGTDFTPERFRCSDYGAYYRQIKQALELAVSAEGKLDTYPDPAPQCDVCRWSQHCDKRRRDDDHLSLVAGISKQQINEFKDQKLDTLQSLAEAAIPFSWKPSRGASESYERVQNQARVQHEGRVAGDHIYELLDVEPGLGLSRLPPPSPGDIFFDLEGDRFVEDGGIEYLFGYVLVGEDGKDDYRYQWAFDRTDEKRVFEEFIDFVIDRLESYPELHIYHYAPYEPSAMKQLMGRYATREEQVDRLLRAGTFVDLYAVVRQSLIASVESYSIKRLEPFYHFEREINLWDANQHLSAIHIYLETAGVELVDDHTLDVVRGYNCDDCVSTRRLRDWLEDRRSQIIEQGGEIDRPEQRDPDPSEDLSEHMQRINALRDRLVDGVPDDPNDRTDLEQGRWILAHSLDWHRREAKSKWWEYFRLADLTSEELIDERAALSGMEFIERIGGTSGAPIDRYRFQAQECDFRGGEDLCSEGGEPFGYIDEIHRDSGLVDVKKRRDTKDFHPEGIFEKSKNFPTKKIENAIFEIGTYVADNGIDGDAQFLPARDLLTRHLPRLGNHPIKNPEESSVQSVKRLASVIEGGVLPIQGPPGTGKTYSGARMISEFVKLGKKVGVTANSYAVIRNLLDAVVGAGIEDQAEINCVQKVQKAQEDTTHITFETDNMNILEALQNSEANVAAGTAFMWATEDFVDSVDVLFVDEAAQMSLPNVLAASQAANTLILLGDPQQLEQPQQGSHPPGTDKSALHHILGEHHTIDKDQGLFLEETWRLHPDICQFTSDLFYEGKLDAKPGLENQIIRSTGPINGSGLRYLPVKHTGNQNSSIEEVDVISSIFESILSENASWVNMDGDEQKLTLDDILIIAPYNAQVFNLQQQLPEARIGTVDKFQGQEAPIVIYSMTSSSPEDAPRGMEFLYSLNRLNVATSRARALCILVGSPRLFEPDCRTPRQMQLANAFCRYQELATAIG